MMIRFPAFTRLATLALAALWLAGCASGGVRQAAPASGAIAPSPAATASASGVDTAHAVAGTGATDPAVMPAQALIAVGDGTDRGVPETAETVREDAANPAAGPTPAELDAAALYGTPIYDPVADPSLPAPATLPSSHDPWEKWNRKVHRFNSGVDRILSRPLAKAYETVVPRPARLGVTNFFNNLGQPVSALNALLQGRPKQAGQALGRFLLNATLGIGGIFDPASDAGLPLRSEDFGQTLGVWGWKTSRYVELPLLGPRTVRDSFGLVGDAPLSPIRQVDDDTVRYGLQGLRLLDLRTQLFAVDAMREGAIDEYALVRDAWLQRRNYQIRGDQTDNAGQELPDYLYEDESDPILPVDVIPVIPPPN